ENSFYGSSITVSGLLTGSDLVNAVSDSEADLYLLPPNILNPDGLTLDNMTVRDIAGKTGKKVLQYNGDISEVFNNL
ncbi:MAG: DUF512 domain-containing protein, partial [bacterium]|nr:DUF512 domain-containing protein [bacterium]